MKSCNVVTTTVDSRTAAVRNRLFFASKVKEFPMKTTTCKTIHRIKYDQRMKAEKAQWKERQHRALISARFAALVADTGLGIEGVGKLLHVTTRTVRNWISGQTNIPYSAYKLLRLLRFMERFCRV